MTSCIVLSQTQFNSQDRLHQLSSAEEMLQLRQRFGSSASVTPSESASAQQLPQCHDDGDDVTDDTCSARPTCRRESVASSSSSRSVSFLRLRSHSLRYSQQSRSSTVQRRRRLRKQKAAGSCNFPTDSSVYPTAKILISFLVVSKWGTFAWEFCISGEKFSVKNVLAG